ncbi:MAG: beta-lactamase family protein [Cyanobacteria bacterium SZAS LIN-2]|nr:beta-lactamase family protein [Cyanobacteria bacterium SZAS LIN-2]
MTVNYFKSVTIGILLASLLHMPQAGAQSLAEQTAVPDRSGGNPEQTRLAAISAMVHQTVAEQNVPGYAIAILKGGRVVYQETLGLADLESGRPVTGDTIFGLASVTKTFTGLALLHLVDQGKIKLDATLDQYLQRDRLPPAWRKLTIAQLAGMRAGLPESRADELPWPEEMPYLEGQPLAYEPGTQFVYSNPSFRVLGSVIEAVSGMPYLDYIGKVILQPLGMTSTGTVATMAGTGRVSTQYDDRQGRARLRVIAPKNPMTSYSAGMLASSLKDMCAYSQALLDHKILSPAAYQTYMMDRPPLANGQPATWAFGWGSTINKKVNQRVIGMNGGLPGVASTVLLLPDSNVAVVALSNLRKKPVYAIAKRAMAMFVGAQDGESNQGPDEAAGAEPAGPQD